MRLLFVYSTKFKKDTEGNLYTDGSVNEELWKRYTNISSNLEIISRLDQHEYTQEFANEKFNKFDSTNKKFIKVPDLFLNIRSFFNIKKRNDFNKIIESKIKESDIIIARVPSTEGYVAVHYAQKYNIPYLVEVVGCPRDSLWNHSYKGKLFALTNYFAMKKAIKNAPYVLYVTNKFLQERYPSKGKTIGCSDVILSKLDFSVLEKRLTKIGKKNRNTPIVLGTVAAIDVRYKGQEFVIKAISNLNKKGHNFEYHLAGGGDNSYLMKIAKKFDVSDKVKFLGTIPHEEVFRYLDAIDIYIQPSKLEGLPRALVEAMSRGCPSLGSRIGGIPELLQEGSLFKKGEVDEICELLKKVDQSVLINEAKRNFIKAQEFYPDILAKKRENFYEEFIESKGRKND